MKQKQLPKPQRPVIPPTSLPPPSLPSPAMMHATRAENYLYDLTWKATVDIPMATYSSTIQFLREMSQRGGRARIKTLSTTDLITAKGLTPLPEDLNQVYVGYRFWFDTEIVSKMLKENRVNPEAVWRLFRKYDKKPTGGELALALQCLKPGGMLVRLELRKSKKIVKKIQ